MSLTETKAFLDTLARMLAASYLRDAGRRPMRRRAFVESAAVDPATREERRETLRLCRRAWEAIRSRREGPSLNVSL